ncbi:uncharacterized protein DUF1837 [Arcticibacter tournemirensis]|uniref:DUF1837 domain-containing protein n=2 Tax=Arcticibacter tournemirensis TaxID=699437 RepID=A0A5M9HK69_9SPHI|nr:DUF1837 domain-containing protein [Arcticibacter tournemirensis]TQM50321.1 uncharacterized protein DUF1837 [Arcticibacter tournemirensis]
MLRYFLIYINIVSFIGVKSYKSNTFHRQSNVMAEFTKSNPDVLSGELDVSPDHYASIIDHIQEDCNINDRLQASFHFIKYHDCVNRESDFLKTLSGYLVQYCFSKQRYKSANVFEIQQLFIEARDKFFNPKDSSNGRSGASRSGELGEIALYFLLESYLKSPQIVSKMALKTTGGENYKGSDGIHVGIVNNKKCFFYCESKLNKVKDNAFSSCIASVINFHLDKKDFEVSVVNNHIEIENDNLRQAVLDFLNPSKPKGDDWLEVNACFIGFDWPNFIDIEKCQPNEALMKKLTDDLKLEIETIKKHITDTIIFPTIKHRFFFFVMPFKDVENMRKNFLKLLYGGK